MKLVESATPPLSPWHHPMKTFDAHYQEAEQALLDIVTELSARTEIEKVICFGRRMNTDLRIGSFDPLKLNANCHYYLLVITETLERQEHTLQDFVNARFKLGKITLLAHGKETLDQALGKGSRFFTSVFLYGKLLFSRNGLLETPLFPELDPEKTVEKVAGKFEYHYNLAEAFLQAAGDAQDKEKYTISLFLLHQAMEQGLTALIRVFLGYRADIHSLGRLQDLCLCFCAEEVLFPRQRQEEQRLFQLLQKSYSGARYKQDFVVSEGDAERIYAEVAGFLKRVEVLCEEKMEELAGL